MNSNTTQPARCELHPAFEADYCPTCGTAQQIGVTSYSNLFDAAVEATLATRVCPACQRTGTPLMGRCEFCDSIIDEQSPEFVAAYGEPMTDDDMLPRVIFDAHIDTESDALNNDPSELARILRMLAARIERGETGGLLRDINGNSVGLFGFSSSKDV